MKSSKMFFLAIVAFLLFMSGKSYSQNFFKTEPGMVKIMADTTFTTVGEVTFMPGQKTKVHTHAAQFVYAFTAGTLTVQYSSGKTETFTLNAGDSFLAPPDSPHWTENTGKEPIRFLLVEYNEHPYKEMKMKK